MVCLKLSYFCGGGQEAANPPTPPSFPPSSPGSGCPGSAEERGVTIDGPEIAAVTEVIGGGWGVGAGLQLCWEGLWGRLKEKKVSNFVTNCFWLCLKLLFWPDWLNKIVFLPVAALIGKLKSSYVNHPVVIIIVMMMMGARLEVKSFPFVELPQGGCHFILFLFSVNFLLTDFFSPNAKKSLNSVEFLCVALERFQPWWWSIVHGQKSSHWTADE